MYTHAHVCAWRCGELRGLLSLPCLPYLPACLPSYLATCLPTCLPACYLSAGLPAYLSYLRFSEGSSRFMVMPRLSPHMLLIQLVTVSSQSTCRDANQPLQGFAMHHTITS